MLHPTHSPWSLRRRILAIFMLCVMAAFICLGIFVGFIYWRLVVKRVDSSYENTVAQLTLSMGNIFDALNHVSQQLAYNDLMQAQFERFLQTDVPYDRINAVEEMKASANYTVFSNPYIGFYYYLDAQSGDIYLSNLALNRHWDRDNHYNTLFQYVGVSYYGLERSQSNLTDALVIAAVRELEIAGHTIHLYVETGFRTIRDVLESYQLDTAHLLLIDNDGQVVYSLSDEVFPVGTHFSPDVIQKGKLQDDGHVIFVGHSNQGWHAAIAVEKSAYTRELLTLNAGVLIVIAVLTIVYALLSFVLRNQISRPMARFDAMMDVMLTQQRTDPGAPTGIIEFDRMLSRFQSMQAQVHDMIEKNREQERINAQIEVQRLRSQINPHFLMNTLNTVHWMALLQGEDEIDDMVLSLNRLLMYNLKKDDSMATLADEAQAVEQYVHLQMKRYTFTYERVISPEGSSLDVPFPKFILQPMIENCLAHGYRENLKIRLCIDIGERITISVEDDGVGMTEAQVALLLSHLQGDSYRLEETINREGMGIGLRYVVKTLHMFYGDDVIFHVSSAPYECTQIQISVPRISIRENMQQ